VHIQEYQWQIFEEIQHVVQGKLVDVVREEAQIEQIDQKFMLFGEFLCILILLGSFQSIFLIMVFLEIAMSGEGNRALYRLALDQAWNLSLTRG
ncbi:hypothetical protein ACJX0J_008586, partial [Zea mays]